MYRQMTISHQLKLHWFIVKKEKITQGFLPDILVKQYLN